MTNQKRLEYFAIAKLLYSSYTGYVKRRKDHEIKTPITRTLQYCQGWKKTRIGQEISNGKDERKDLIKDYMKREKKSIQLGSLGIAILLTLKVITAFTY